MDKCLYLGERWTERQTPTSSVAGALGQAFLGKRPFRLFSAGGFVSVHDPMLSRKGKSHRDSLI